MALCCTAAAWAALSLFSCSIGDGDALSQLTVDDPLFLATGAGGVCYVSMDGMRWTYAGTTSIDNYCSAYNDGRFVAAGRNGLNIYAAESFDLVNWQSATAAIEGNVNGIIYQNGMVLMAVADNNPGIYQYLNGDIKLILSNGSLSVNCISYGNGLFVAGGASGSLFVSGDGAAWGQVAGISADYTFNDALYARGLFVLVGSEAGGGGKSLITISQSGFQGYTTNLYTGTVSTPIDSIAYGNGRFVAAGGMGEIWWSDDGYLWSYLQVPQLAVTFIHDITFGNGMFVLVTQSGGIYCSKDGILWQQVFSSGTSLYTVTCRR